MRRIMRWRYYCDFCKKSSGRTLADHERHCTMNPNRVCRFCKLLGETQAPMAELLAALRSESPVLPALQRAAHDCPACILAAIRQLPADELAALYADQLNENLSAFDYKAASKDALEAANSEVDW